MNSLDAKTAFFVGDSMEDLYMSRKAEQEGDLKIKFIGVYGSSTTQQMIRKFKESHADIIIKM